MPVKPLGKACSVQLSRTYDAPAEKVFQAWFDRKAMTEWLASGGKVLQTPAVDGLYYIGMIGKDNHVWPHYGRYLRVEAPRLLEFTWMSAGTHGHESQVSLEFVSRGSRTALKLSHTGLPDEAMQVAHTEGWTHFLGVLADRLDSA